jgi:hypothetical protein
MVAPLYPILSHFAWVDQKTGRHCISHTATPEAIMCTSVLVYPFDV